MKKFFHINPGPPQALKNCLVSNHSMTSLLIHCEAGESGGLAQCFNIEVYIKDNNEQHSNISCSRKAIFLINKLPPGTTFRLKMYASNDKGISSLTFLQTSTLATPEKQTSSSK